MSRIGIAVAASLALVSACGQAPSKSAAPASTGKTSAGSTAPAAPAKPASTSKPAASSTASKPAPLKNVQFSLDFLPNGYHGPVVDALYNGYFKQQGLNVHMTPGKGSLTTVEQVGTGAATFGFADFGAMLQAVAKGAPVKAVMVVTQETPLCITTRASSHVTKPSQLKGMTFAIIPGGIDSYMLPAFLAATHVPRADVKTINVTPPEKLSVFINRKVNALVGFANFEIPALEAKGIKLNNMCYANYGLNLLEDSIIASNATIKNHPNMVKGFVKAVSEGYAYAAQHPKTSVMNAKKFFGAGASFSVPLGVTELEASLHREHTPATKGKPFGWVANSNVVSTLARYKEYEGVKTNLPPSTFYTNQFIP